ncbi:MAG: hypothetical protein JW751_02260 [Polyangiaceae bacterium]|nr:hypothetical protein [Polyangiaceae bacterium]
MASSNREDRPSLRQAHRKRRLRAGARRSEMARAARAAREPESYNPPEFVRHFPSDPALAGLVAAFERGNYRWVRVAAPRLAKATKSEAVRRAALELRRRVDPDPLATVLLGIAVALLGFLLFWTYFLPHGS